MPRICWQTIFICGKPQRYDKPLKQLGLLSRQADIRRVTGASSVNLRQAVGLPKANDAGGRLGVDREFINLRCQRGIRGRQNFQLDS